MEKLHESSIALSSSVEILRTNEILLREKIKELPFGAYEDIILNYFDELFMSTSQNESYTVKRSRQVTKALKELWVIKHHKKETFLIFENFEKFEEDLFQMENYRGHYIHQFYVFVLGHYILNKLLENNNINTVFRKTVNEPHFTWMVASTFHDMGYPIEKIDDWFSFFLNDFLKIETLYKIDIERILTQNYFEYVKYISKTHFNLRIGQPYSPYFNQSKDDWKFHNLLLTYLRKKDHGVVSSLILLHSLLTQEKFTDDEHYFYGDLPYQIMPACHAISIHNFRNIKINFKEYPYAFLLILCDELQDWGRSSKEKDISELRDVEIVLQDIPIINITLRINHEKKTESLNTLKSILETDNLIEIVIKDEKGTVICELPTNDKLNNDNNL